MAEKKLTDKEFWVLMYECGGIYARVVRAALENHKIEIKRQSVRERALSKPDMLAECIEINKDTAEEIVQSTMRNKKDKRLAYDAAKWYLERQAGERGYNPKQELEITGTIDVSKTTRFSIKKRPKKT